MCKFSLAYFSNFKGRRNAAENEAAKWTMQRSLHPGDWSQTERQRTASFAENGAQEQIEVDWPAAIVYVATGRCWRGAEHVNTCTLGHTVVALSAAAHGFRRSGVT